MFYLNMETSQRYSTLVIAHFTKAQARVLKLIEDLTEAQLTWTPGPTAPSIAFHLWHLARWADHLQSNLPGMTDELGRRLGPSDQLWQRDNVAAAWGWDTFDLGLEATGMSMEGESVLRLTTPSKTMLLDYAQRTFAAVEQALNVIDDAQWLAQEREQFDTDSRSALGPSGTVGDAIVTHLCHINRHLGMIECLRGIQGLRGTASS